MINLQKKDLFVSLSLILLLALFVITPVFAAELGEAAESSAPAWFKYLEIFGGILALTAVVQGMMMIARCAGGSLAKSFLWYPVGAMFIGLSLVIRMIMEFGNIDFFALELGFELCIYLGLLSWVLGTQKSLKSLG
ncbi:MAG: hypothetical protein Q7S84_01855 [bacterium]|nr:hypothetical protein [bacterium]